MSWNDPVNYQQSSQQPHQPLSAIPGVRGGPREDWSWIHRRRKIGLVGHVMAWIALILGGFLPILWFCALVSYIRWRGARRERPSWAITYGWLITGLAILGIAYGAMTHGVV